MPTKRGRPLSATSSDTALQRRRQQTATRVRLHRERQEAATLAASQPTPEQAYQQDTVIERLFAATDVATTQAQLGLRIENLSLAQNFSDAQLQQQSTPINDHDTLYNPTVAERPAELKAYNNSIPLPLDPSSPNLIPSVLPTYPARSSIPSFFRTLPPQSPFAPSRSQQDQQPSLPSLEPQQPSFPPLTERSTESQRIGGSEDNDNPFFGADQDEDLYGASDTEINPTDNAGEFNNIEDNSRPVSRHTQHSSRYSSDEDTSSGSFDPAEAPVADHTPDPEPSPLEVTAKKLFAMLQSGFHGCPVESHQEDLQAHVNAHGNNHHSLDEVSSDLTFPSVLPLAEFLTPERLTRTQLPEAEQWRSMFCGIPAGQRSQRPIQVCLHKEETREIEPGVAFDVDSFLGFASSLAFARQGLSYQPAPQTRQNLSTDVHLHTTAYAVSADPDAPPVAKTVMLKDTAHCYLGRVEGASEISIYVLFPHLEPDHGKFISLTAQQLSRWLDEVFHPAVYRYYEPHYTQHLPASYCHAQASSRARQVEDRVTNSGNYQTSQLLHYHLQPEHLHAIWDEVLHTTAHSAGLREFRDPQLFFSAKGTKLQFKSSPSRPTLLDVIENFQTYFDRIVDPGCVVLDRFYVDLGKEICANVGSLVSARPHIHDEAQVYLWRRCCLQHHLRWLYDGPPPKSGQRFYHVSMLRDACNLTSLTPRRSTLRQGGLIYSQFYGSVKEMSDAAKSFPFQNDSLEEMALDPLIRQGARDAGGNAGRHNLRVVEQAYWASKRRTQYALADSGHKSFGVREEHRISWPLLLALRTRLHEERENLEVVMFDCPEYVWPIKTSVYTHFLWRHVDKFATGFELVRARSRQDYTTWEQTKMMAMFLRCLRFALNAHQLSRESALWWGRRETVAGPRPRTWYGLGFSNTLERYGYCWLEPRFDWEQLTFLPRVTDDVMFGNHALRSRYLRRGGHVRAFDDTFLKLEKAVGWLQRHHAQPRICHRLVAWIVHLCLHQFRVDVLHAVGQEIHSEEREDAFHGRHPFTHDYFTQIMGDDLHLVSGNRSDFKTPMLLARALFGFDDGRARTHWGTKPYRTLYQRALLTLRQRADTSRFADQVQHQLWPSLFAFHWILPYPSVDVFTQTTKTGARMWYSICPSPDAVGDIRLLTPVQWQWAGKTWWDATKPKIPSYVSWDPSQWQAWVHRNIEEE